MPTVHHSLFTNVNEGLNVDLGYINDYFLLSIEGVIYCSVDKKIMFSLLFIIWFEEEHSLIICK